MRFETEVVDYGVEVEELERGKWIFNLEKWKCGKQVKMMEEERLVEKEKESLKEEEQSTEKKIEFKKAEEIIEKKRSRRFRNEKGV